MSLIKRFGHYSSCFFAAAILLYLLVADMAPPHVPGVPFIPLFLPAGGLARAGGCCWAASALSEVIQGCEVLHR